MLATNGPQWFDRRTDSVWSSIGISILATGALFASAFFAMTSARSWVESRVNDREAEVAVHLTLPTPLPAPVSKPVAQPSDLTRRRRSAPPATVPPLTTPIPPLTTPSVILEAPTKSTAIAPDSGLAKGTAATTTPMVSTPPSGSSLPSISRAGAPVAPAGVTRMVRTRNTPSVRDSLARARMAEIPELARHYVPNGTDLAAAQGSQRVDAMLHQRATSAGMAPAYVAGPGVDGVGAVKPGTVSTGAGGSTNIVLYSIPLPLFYPGPSPEQRRRDSIVNADNLARLARLKARADSLAHKIVP